MAEFATSGLSVADVLALIAANSALSFVGGGAPMLLSELAANYPAGPANAGKYAVVSNMYNGMSPSTVGGIQEVARCRPDVTNGTWVWTAQRPDYNRTMAATGGSVSLVPLVSAPSIILNGTLLSGLTVTPSPTGAWVGQRYRLIQNSTLGLFTTTIAGLIGSNITLLGNAERVLEFTSAGWREMAS